MSKAKSIQTLNYTDADHGKKVILTADGAYQYFDPTPAVNVQINPARVRQIHKSLFSTKDALTTNEAEAFLLLYSEQLTDGMNKFVREFIQEKLKW